MTSTKPRNSCRIARRAVKQGARPTVVPTLAQCSKNLLQSHSKFMKCKQTTLISTFNVRTLNTINQLPELVASAIALNIHVICVQEHRFHHEDLDLKHHETGKGWTFISASAWKNTNNSTIGGVGMLLSPTALKSLNNIEKIQPRLIIATFNGNPATYIISCYSPTNISEEEEVSLFYQELSSLVRQVPKHNVLIIGGDMNSQIGRNDDHKFAFHMSTNRNGLISCRFYNRKRTYLSLHQVSEKELETMVVHICKWH